MKIFSKTEQDQISAEIERLHQFFIDWFNGIVPETQDCFQQFSNATSSDFVIVHPSGELDPITKLSPGLYNAYNKRSGLNIKVKNMQIQHKMGDYYLATYEEWQLEKGDAEWSGRISTVLLSKNESAPAGLMWHHVHETWLPKPTI
jgi:hypothetical protein